MFVGFLVKVANQKRAFPLKVPATLVYNHTKNTAPSLFFTLRICSDVGTIVMMNLTKEEENILSQRRAYYSAAWKKWLQTCKVPATKIFCQPVISLRLLVSKILKICD